MAVDGWAAICAPALSRSPFDGRLKTPRWSAGHFLNQEALSAIGQGELRNFMQDQYMPRAISARSTHYSLTPHKQIAARQPTAWRKPTGSGLTQAQLQRIVLEQLG